ncbi:DNA primase/helicase [Synechococcus phage S-BM3]|nr:DNA primase/helicase [Synechococcus phage S-BM3]
MEKIELTILRNFIHDEDYCRKVIPFVKPEYFQLRQERIVFEEIAKFTSKFNNLATKEILSIEIENRDDINDKEASECLQIVSSLHDDDVDNEWISETTERWCRDRAIYLALMESISIADGKDEKKTRDAIPTILSDALAVSFDQSVGHDYFLDYESRYEYYHKKEEKIGFDLDYFNKITKGGLPNKTLNIALAGTGVGKSLFMCHVASSVLLQGRNVLYITMEMAEERIAERIDANLLNVNIQEISDLPHQLFQTKVNKIEQKTQGTLIIKEYPTASAHSGHFKALLNELALKKSFRPDIIFIDYLNICASERYRGNSTVNSYSYIKAIAEELRGLAVEANVPVVSATQTTRTGYSSSDVDITDTSESFGLPATADLMFALISTEELEQQGSILVKQLKNRYNDISINKRFLVGIDRAKMRLFDCEQSAQNDLLDSGQEVQYDNEESPFKTKTQKYAEFIY